MARKYVILLEPAYEFANKEIRSRMDSHGYCRGLKETAELLGFDVTRNEVFVCPQFKTPLKEIDSVMYSPEVLVAYPIMRGIP